MKNSGKNLPRVLVVDDHEMTRAGLKLLFSSTENIGKVFFRPGLGSLKEDFEAMQPDVLVLDLILQDGSGLEALDIVHAVSPETHTVILTGRDAVADLLTAKRKGVAALVSKADPSAAILEAVEQALAGYFYCSPRFAAMLDETSEKDLLLSKRQQQLLSLLAEGLANKEISYQLNIAEVTVSHHLRELRGRLGVATVREILPKALEMGLISSLPS